MPHNASHLFLGVVTFFLFVDLKHCKQAVECSYYVRIELCLVPVERLNESARRRGFDTKTETPFFFRY